ncbi:hypothetical protein AOLI_G00272270 [Acnodon oligacanthus]
MSSWAFMAESAVTVRRAPSELQLTCPTRRLLKANEDDQQQDGWRQSEDSDEPIRSQKTEKHRACIKRR